MMASVERYLAEQRKQQSISMAPWETKAIEKIRELETENARLRKALEFYAKADNYEPWRESDSDRTDAFNFVDLDGGNTAREALQNGD